MTADELLCDLRERLEARVDQVRGRRAEQARAALEGLPALVKLVQDPIGARTALLVYEMFDALPRGKPRGRPLGHFSPAIAGRPDGGEAIGCASLDASPPSPGPSS